MYRPFAQVIWTAIQKGYVHVLEWATCQPFKWPDYSLKYILNYTGYAIRYNQFETFKWLVSHGYSCSENERAQARKLWPDKKF